MEHSVLEERAIAFSNPAGQRLLGVWHPADGPARATLILLHGWSGYRTGPHQMLTRAARAFAENGFAVLRFDFAGRGDSEGDASLATLATMAEDTRVALAFCREQTEAPALLLGLCSGCEIVVAAAADNVAGCVLWSAPIFAALPSAAIAAQKRAGNLRAYARKLLRPATWKKLLTGQVDRGAVSKAMHGGGGAAEKNVESNSPGQLPPGFRNSCLARWDEYGGPRLQIYGGADPIFEDAAAWYGEHAALPADVHIVEGANHSFYGLAWEREVIDVTLDWLGRRWPSE